MNKRRLERDFPGLKNSDYKITSKEDISYNCIAWAAGDSSRYWWPDQDNDGYWPPGVKREEPLESFVEAFETLGYSVCDSADYEVGFEKIALYATTSGEPTHAARQVCSNKWTTKVGQLEDIEHKLEDIQGLIYGNVAIYMKKPL
jgi:hypothetical protein